MSLTSEQEQELFEMLEDLLPGDYEIQDWQVRVLNNMLHGAWERGVHAMHAQVSFNFPTNNIPTSPYGGFR